MLDAELMIFEVVSHDSRAPSVRKQKQDNRADGYMPEKTLDFPEDHDIFALALSPHEPDVVLIAAPKVLGSAKVARAALFAMGRAGASVKLPGEDPISMDTEEAQVAFLARVASTPWGKGTVKQRRNRGRPPKRKQPTETQKATYCAMWGKPDQFDRQDILVLAGEELGRKVREWEIKHWCGDARTQKD